MSKYIVEGDFLCYGNELHSLEGCPIEVGGDFDCSYNHLTSLEGCPEKVGKQFNAMYNGLESLKGFPKEVGGGVELEENSLKSLEGISDVVYNFLSLTNNEITSLEYFPIMKLREYEEYGKVLTIDISFNLIENLKPLINKIPHDIYYFNCSDNNITSLEGCPEDVEQDFLCQNNNLTSLRGCPMRVGRNFHCYGQSTNFTEEDVRSVCDVGGEIFVDKSKFDDYIRKKQKEFDDQIANMTRNASNNNNDDILDFFNIGL